MLSRGGTTILLWRGREPATVYNGSQIFIKATVNRALTHYEYNAINKDAIEDIDMQQFLTCKPLLLVLPS